VIRIRTIFDRMGQAAAIALLSALPATLRAQEPVAVQPAGETQAEAPKSELPEPAAPAPELPIQHVSEPSVVLTLRAPQSIALFSTRQVEGAKAHRHCSGDCDIHLAPGRYSFALASGLGKPVKARGTFRLEASDVLEARYASAKKHRIVGGLMLGLVTPTAFTWFVTGIKAYATLDEICNADGCHDAKLSAGLISTIAFSAVLTAASAGLGGWLVRRKDRAYVELGGMSAANRLEEPVARAALPEPPAPKLEPQPSVSDLPEQGGLPPPSTVARGSQSVVKAPVEPRAPEPLHNIEPRADLAKVAQKRGELTRCFPEKLTERLELRIDIAQEGHMSNMSTSSPLAPRVEKCLGRVLGNIQFDVGLPRTVRVNVAR
jgi:hypothetical protein